MIYLASPYSHEREAVRETRFHDACDAASHLMRQGHRVYSPIAHTHPVAQHGLPLGWDFWEPYDRWFVERCDEVWVLTLEGWSESKGVRAEIRIAEELGKPVRYLVPGTYTFLAEDAA